MRMLWESMPAERSSIPDYMVIEGLSPVIDDCAKDSFWCVYLVWFQWLESFSH